MSRPKKTEQSKGKKKTKIIEINLVPDILMPLKEPEAKVLKSKLPGKGAHPCVEQAIKDGILEEKNEKKKVYVYLTDSGKGYLLRNLPVEQRLQEFARIEQGWRSISTGLLSQLNTMSKHYESFGMLDVFASIFHEVARLCQDASSKINELANKSQAIREVAIVCEEYLRKINALQKNFEEQAQNQKTQAESMITQAQKEKQEITQNIEKLRQQMDALSKAIVSSPNASQQTSSDRNQPVTRETRPAISGDTLSASVTNSGAISPASVPTQPSIAPAQPSLDIPKLTAAMERCYHKIIAPKFLSKIASFPELYNELKPEFPTLTVIQYKDVLNQLGNQDVVNLHPVADKSEVTRPEFGINISFGGILYYVSWRK